MTRQSASSKKPKLRRVMGPELLLLFIVGDILGAGAYAVTGTIAGIAWCRSCSLSQWPG